MEYILRKGSITAKAASLGGELISLQRDGREYIWQGSPQSWTGRNPNLFPAIGAIAPEGARFGGRSYPLKRHGFARGSEFVLAEQGEDYAELELRENPETLAQYPFPFRLRIRHQLTEEGFITRYSVHNPGTEPLPFCLGGHTAFNCPGEFGDWRLVFDRAEDAWAMLPLAGGRVSFDNREHVLQNTDTLVLDHAIFDRVDTLIFDTLASRTVSLVGPEGRGVRMEFADFPIIAFWTMPGKNAPYLCLEPWLGCGALAEESGEFADKPHCRMVQPGETAQLQYTVTLL